MVATIGNTKRSGKKGDDMKKIIALMVFIVLLVASCDIVQPVPDFDPDDYKRCLTCE